MSAPTERRVLLLQGPPTRFFDVLRGTFTDAGVPCERLFVHAGEALRARLRGRSYRGRLSEFDGYLDDLIAREGVTDLIYFADRLPYHRVAARVAERRGATPYALENGYLRPDWLTLEPAGMGAFSRFPTDRAAIERIAEGAPAIRDEVEYRHAFALEAYCDVTYNLASTVGWPVFPHYDRDRPNHPIREYLSWLPQLVRRQVARARAPGQLARIIGEGQPFFLFPMQLQEDYQIRHNSPYSKLSEAVHEIFSTFARSAPSNTSLLVKIHPLDNGLENWQRVLKRAKRDYGLTGRIRMLSAGSLPDMLDHCEGVVLVNSTVGLTTLRRGKPLKALGVAVYDIPGLTDSHSLDDFWRDPVPPDPSFVDAFVRALARATQLKGSFYDPAGMQAGAREIVRRVLAGVGSGDWFVRPPPRLVRARQLGLDLGEPEDRLG